MFRTTVEKIVAGDILTLKTQLGGLYQVKVKTISETRKASRGYFTRRAVISHWRYAPGDPWTEMPKAANTITLTSVDSITVENPELF